VLTRAQVRTTRAVVQWYLGRYHGRREDLGVAHMFLDRARIGHFAVSRDAFTRGHPSALFKVFIATTLFQRLSDQHVLNILRGMQQEQVRDVASLSAVRRTRASAACELLRSSAALHEKCDLTKVPGSSAGTCGFAPALPCPLKRHTTLLKRYGHFGKVPTSASLILDEAGAADLRALRAAVLRRVTVPTERAHHLESSLMRVWRVNRKIAAMFLSAVSNPELGMPDVPWSQGIDWKQYVVIDSNTDLFLAAIGYAGPGTYEARHRFIAALSKQVHLDEMKPGLTRYNPRVVQQAMYVFMSRSNRSRSAVDCWAEPQECERCVTDLRGMCPKTARNGSPPDA
jgi:hypothetical protein